MKIAIGGDHGGFDLKEKIKNILQSKKHEVIDLGAHDYVPTDDYPDFCFPVAKMVANNEVDRGIISCMSGIGAVITANKVKGVRAGLCHTEYLARQGVEHDDMNVLCIGSKIVDHEIVENMIEEFLNAKFLTEEKYSRRLKKVIDIEKSEGN
ncbi:MAG: ribose-5-phosphate isomerase [Chloroflexi bacterium]|nr:ribose-5-phosphate isomerase [Chloroflexota bacterium]